MHVHAQDAHDIANGVLLLRRITPSQHTSVQPDGRRLLNSFAFREKEHEFSMYVADEIDRAKLISGPPCGFEHQQIIEITAGEVRNFGYEIIREPDDCDNSHVYARATVAKSRGQIAKDCKALAELVNQRILAAGAG